MSKEVNARIESKRSINWIPGLDWLRVLFISFVVCMHLNIMQTMSRHSLGVTVFDVIYFNLLCAAVPGFLLISSFLLLQKCYSWNDFSKRIKDNGALYLFWVGAWVLVTKSRPDPSFIGILNFLLQGGGWAYYFFAVLILITVQCFLISKLSTKATVCGLFITSIATEALFLFLAADNHAWMTMATYWWPVCFVSIPFVASLLARWSEQIINSYCYWQKALIVALALSVVLSVAEWMQIGPAGQLKSRPFLPDYLRISLVFSACVLFLLALKITYVPSLVRFISRNSLGIFCLHVFVLGAVHQAIHRVVHDDTLALLVTVIVVLVFGAIGSEILRKLLRSRII